MYSGFRWLLLSLILYCGLPLLAQGSWGQVKIDALGSEKSQSDPVVQTRLQQWFVAKVTAYQRCLDDTAVGRATPRIVNPGDFTPALQRLLAAPGGRGQARILFGDVAQPSTLDDIIFPQSRANAYIDNHPDTCWHEFQHLIAIESEQNGRALTIPLAPWEAWRKPPSDGFREHILLESLGEFTVEWLDLLLHETSALTGSTGLGFEAKAQEAWTTIRAYQARNENVTYAVEAAAWAKAHDAWARAWQDRGKLIAPIPAKHRREYETIYGVHIGYVEEVIRLYMRGGLTAPDGSPIRVPEWVMWPDPMISGVIAGHLNEKKTIAGDTLRYGFDVRLLQTYRQREHSASLNHGKVKVTLETPDADAALEIAVDGRPATTSPTSVTVNLSGFTRDSAIRITLARHKLSSFAGVKRYRVTVSYQDDPRIVGGVAKPSFYYPLKAIYYVDVTGARPPVAPAPAGGGKPASKPSTPATPAAKGRWVLGDVTVNKTVDPMYANQPNWTFAISLNETENTFESVYHNTDRNSKDPDRVTRTRHSWNAPGATLLPYTKAAVTITNADNGSANAVDPKSTPFSASSTLSAWTRRKGSAMAVGLFSNPTFGGMESSGGSVSIPAGQTAARQSVTVQIPIPEGAPGDTLHVQVKCLLAAMMSEVTFNYRYVTGQPTPPAPIADAVLTATEPAPKPDPPPLDNEPPKDGEVVKLLEQVTVNVDPPPPSPPRRRPVEAWYIHPTADYRFKLAKNWTIHEKHFFDAVDNGYDTLWPPDKGIAFICARDVTDNGTQTADAVLKSFADKMLASNPGAKSERFSPGNVAPAVRIAVHDKVKGIITWHIAIFFQGRKYYLAVSMPAKTPIPFPDQVAWMLGTLVIGRD